MTNLLSITALAPVVNQSVDSFHERLVTEGESFTSTIDRGFNTAKFLLRGSPRYLNSWFAGGLARDVIWKGPHGQTIFNGYVSRLALTEGESTRVKSIDKMFNRVVLIYRTVDSTQNPPLVGAQTTLTVNNTTSQDVFGIKVAVVSGGESTTDEATDQANSHLEEMSRIGIEEKISTGGSPPFLSVDMRGYSYFADWYTYTNVASGTVLANATANAVIAADPNSVLSTNTTNVDTSTTAIAQDFDGKGRGWKIIQEIAGVGDSSVPWCAQIWEGRKLTFKVKEGVDSTGQLRSTNKHLALERQPMDAGFRIVDRAGREIKPWDMRPDHLVFTAGRRGEEPLLVTAISYTAPYTISLSGSDLVTPEARKVRA